MKISYPRRHVCEKNWKIDLIENNAIVNYEALQQSTTSPKTLHVIEARQNRERGLLHISDAAYAFFFSLQQLRACWQNQFVQTGRFEKQSGWRFNWKGFEQKISPSSC